MPNDNAMTIIGAGVIGMSIAYDLAKHGCCVRVFEAGQPGREASWAGAGILTPSSGTNANHPYDELRALSWDLHPQLAADLKEETSIDNGFHACGAVAVARSPGESAMLLGYQQMLEDEGIEVRDVTAEQLQELEPQIDTSAVQQALLIPAESQLRNPRHMQALTAACRARGVDVVGNTQVRELRVEGGSIAGLISNDGTHWETPGPVCVAAGPWSQALLQGIGVHTGVLPIRGQIVLFQCEQPRLSRIIWEGPRYLVPRDDGRILAGSTEEEVGFVKETTSEAIDELTRFAIGLVPQLARERIEQSWAGLRPASFDGLPYLGRLPNLDNGFVAAGHFRSGLFLSTGTAVVLSQAMRNVPTDIDLSPFHVNRA